MPDDCLIEQTRQISDVYHDRTIDDNVVRLIDIRTRRATSEDDDDAISIGNETSVLACRFRSALELSDDGIATLQVAMARELE